MLATLVQYQFSTFKATFIVKEQRNSASYPDGSHQSVIFSAYFDLFDGQTTEATFETKVTQFCLKIYLQQWVTFKRLKTVLAPLSSVANKKLKFYPTEIVNEA